MKRKWKILIGVLVLSVLGIGVYASTVLSKKGVVTVQTGTVVRQDLTSLVTASGEIKSWAAGPKMAWKAFVSLFWAAATSAFTAWSGDEKVCSAAADALGARRVRPAAKISPAGKRQLEMMCFIVCLWVKGLEHEMEPNGRWVSARLRAC